MLLNSVMSETGLAKRLPLVSEIAAWAVVCGLVWEKVYVLRCHELLVSVNMSLIAEVLTLRTSIRVTQVVLALSLQTVTLPF